MKRGTARRGTDGRAGAMIAAEGLAERYARSLPTDHEWPLFLIVSDVGYCFDIWADFSGNVLLLGVGERPDFIDLDPRRPHVADVGIVIGGTSLARVNQQLGDRVLARPRMRLS